LHEQLALQDPLDGGGYKHVPATEIPVEAFDLILLWPLRIKDVSASRDSDAAGTPWQSPDEQLTKWTRWIIRDGTGPWRERTEVFPHREGTRAEREFSEFAYFHPFVRNFLYVSRDDLRATNGVPRNRNLRVLQRTDVSVIDVSFYLHPGTVSCRLAVDRVELYLFDTGIAFLALRATWAEGQAKPLLATILKLQDVVRRLYAPYWSGSGGFHGAGHCPDELSITIGGDKIEAFFGTYGQTTPQNSPQRQAAAEQVAYVSQHREPLPVAPWRKLLEPIEPVTTKSAAADLLQFVQIEDERLQLFSYIGVPDPRAIHPADWVRLATVDDPGRSDCFPYAPGFVAEQGFAQFAYDRFWDPTGKPPATEYLTKTRWLCCGYGFTGVGSSLDTDFFADSQAGARAHFHHHYFHLGLIAHFHRASLLNFKYRLTGVIDAWRKEAADSGGRDAQRAFAVELDRVQRDFLLFRNMYWCTEVSNQAQGRELFDLWSMHLNTRPLFEQVNAELQEATELVSGWRQQWSLEDQHGLLLKQQESIDEQIEMHRNLEWVELIIVAVYGIEGMAAIRHLLHEQKVISAIVLMVAAPLVGWFAYRMLGLHKHHKASDKGRVCLLGAIALLLPLFGVCYSFDPGHHVQNTGSTSKSGDHDGQTPDAETPGGDKPDTELPSPDKLEVESSEPATPTE